MSKRKWEDLTSMSPALVRHGVIDPSKVRVRVWRTEDEFNGLELPRTWRWRHVECTACGTKGRKKEYASWRWISKLDALKYRKSPVRHEAFFVNRWIMFP